MYHVPVPYCSPIPWFFSEYNCLDVYSSIYAPFKAPAGTDIPVAPAHAPSKACGAGDMCQTPILPTRNVRCLYCTKYCHTECLYQLNVEDVKVMGKVVAKKTSEDIFGVCLSCHADRLDWSGHSNRCPCSRPGGSCVDQRFNIVPRHSCAQCQIPVHSNCASDYKDVRFEEVSRLWTHIPVCKACGAPDDVLMDESKDIDDMWFRANKEHVWGKEDQKPKALGPDMDKEVVSVSGSPPKPPKPEVVSVSGSPSKEDPGPRWKFPPDCAPETVDLMVQKSSVCSYFFPIPDRSPLAYSSGATTGGPLVMYQKVYEKCIGPEVMTEWWKECILTFCMRWTFRYSDPFSKQEPVFLIPSLFMLNMKTNLTLSGDGQDMFPRAMGFGSMTDFAKAKALISKHLLTTPSGENVAAKFFQKPVHLLHICNYQHWATIVIVHMQDAIDLDEDGETACSPPSDYSFLCKKKPASVSSSKPLSKSRARLIILDHAIDNISGLPLYICYGHWIKLIWRFLNLAYSLVHPDKSLKGQQNSLMQPFQ